PTIRRLIPSCRHQLSSITLRNRENPRAVSSTADRGVDTAHCPAVLDRERPPEHAEGLVDGPARALAVHGHRTLRPRRRSDKAVEMAHHELSPNFGDGRGQAAATWPCDLTTSIPSVNLTPRMIFSNWL